MTEEECSLISGFSYRGKPDKVMTIADLRDVITQSIKSRLVGATEGFKGFIPIALFCSSFLMKREDELLFVTIDDDGDSLGPSTDARHLFHLLSNDGLLYEVAPEPIVTELLRLRSDAIVDHEKSVKKFLSVNYGIDDLDEWMEVTHGVKPEIAEDDEDYWERRSDQTYQEVLGEGGFD